MSSHPFNEASGRKVLHPLMGVVPAVAGGTVPLDFYMTKPIISGWSWVVAPIKAQEQRLGCGMFLSCFCFSQGKAKHFTHLRFQNSINILGL